MTFHSNWPVTRLWNVQTTVLQLTKFRTHRWLLLQTSCKVLEYTGNPGPDWTYKWQGRPQNLPVADLFFIPELCFVLMRWTNPPKMLFIWRQMDSTELCNMILNQSPCFTALLCQQSSNQRPNCNPPDNFAVKKKKTWLKCPFLAFICWSMQSYCFILNVFLSIQGLNDWHEIIEKENFTAVASESWSSCLKFSEWMKLCVASFSCTKIKSHTLFQSPGHAFQFNIQPELCQRTHNFSSPHHVSPSTLSWPIYHTLFSCSHEKKGQRWEGLKGWFKWYKTHFTTPTGGLNWVQWLHGKCQHQLPFRVVL